MDIILQTILIKDSDSFPSSDLCYRSHPSQPIFRPNSICCPNGSEISFDTYLNCLCIEKWVKYTRVQNVTLRVVLQGRFFIRLFQTLEVNGTITTRMVDEREVSSQNASPFTFPIPSQSQEGLIYFSIIAQCDDCHFISAHYEACVENLNPVELALDICTYRREKYVYANMQMLNESIWHNPHSPLHSHMEAFISDNACTLEQTKFLGLPIHLLPNKNTGGAGGFARGMMEILNRENHFTHIVIMDDDVHILPEALERLYAFLCAIKPEHATRTIAGSMLRLDSEKSYIQQESAGRWLQTRTEPVKNDLDLRDIAQVFENEREELSDYNAWWFSCIPVKCVQRLGFPLPFFIRFDDVEYGLRTGEQAITLGGICIWHEPFENKYNEALEYYQVRNGLIVNALHRPSFTAFHAVLWMIHLFFGNIFRYRYSSMELTFKGIEDFLKGPDFFVNTPPDIYHQTLMAMAVKSQPIDQLNIMFDEAAYRRSEAQNDNALYKKILRMVLLNGAFFPAYGETAVPAYKNAVVSHFGKRRVLNCVGNTGLGFVVTRDNIRALKLFKKFLSICRMMIKSFDEVKQAFLTESRNFSSRKFWDKYLKK